MRRKTATVFAATALMAGGVLVTGAGPASAAAHASVVSPMVEGTFPIKVTGCKISEQIQLQGSPKHDYIRWTTAGGSNGCEAYITINNWIVTDHWLTTNGAESSAWYYDGPGKSANVCVLGNNGASAGCGPTN
ncbi:hypothetical protein [Streptomyces sp. CA-111067]|uniref:hypothetical protein n=1 Tax=Streptomyces sp. CA-111067 TaxID=3240046 RepID=UPI003D96C499